MQRYFECKLFYFGSGLIVLNIRFAYTCPPFYTLIEALDCSTTLLADHKVVHDWVLNVQPNITAAGPTLGQCLTRYVVVHGETLAMFSLGWCHYINTLLHNNLEKLSIISLHLS